MGNDIRDLGGYSPFAYKVTPWSTLFPDLGKYPSQKSINNIYIAKLHTFHLTRLHFLQYLLFLSDVGPTLCQNRSITFDAQAYNTVCETLSKNILDNIAKSPDKVDNDTFIGIVGDFETKLQSRTFFSDKVYSVFFENYYFFVESPYGFIYTTCDQVAIPYSGKKAIYRKIDLPFAILPNLYDALRRYPIITRDGCLRFCYFNDGWKYVNTEVGVDQKGEIYSFWENKDFHFGHPVRKDGEFEYYPLGVDKMRYYKVGWTQITDDFVGIVRGAPMLRKLPFDLVEAFAKPNNS